MKKHLFFLGCLLVISIYNSHAQSFRYEYREYGVNVVPTFDSFSPEEKKDGIIYFDQDYIRNVFNKIAQSHLSREALAKLSERFGYFRIFFKMGTTENILYMEFTIKKEMLELITEKQLRELYNSYKEVKFDMTKADFHGDFDYCSMTIPAYKKP